MTCSELYSFADRRGYSVVCFELPETESLCVELDGRCYIGLDPHLRGVEELEHVAHEIGHAEYGGFYNQYSAFDLIGKAERRAEKWAFFHLCPLSDVRHFRNVPVWEMAEHFGVSVRFMESAISFYRDAGLLF